MQALSSRLTLYVIQNGPDKVVLSDDMFSSEIIEPH